MHDHNHPRGPEAHRPAVATIHGDRKRLTFAVALTSIYLIAEVIGGLLTGSLALLADAGHMLSDVASLGLALGALLLARRPASSDRTYGYHRAEVLAAAVNGIALVAVAVWIVVEAISRVRNPPEVWAGPMLAVATGGLIINLLVLSRLHGGHDHSLNLRGAWLHVLADTLGSVGAITSGAIIWFTGWQLADPLASILIALLVLGSAVNLLSNTAHVLMEGAPARPRCDEVRAEMVAVAGVGSIHDLHLWTLGHGRKVLTAHVVKESCSTMEDLLPRLQGRLEDRFGLTHVTLQVESPPGCEGDCSLDPHD